MALTATYDATLSRMQLAATGLNALSTYAVVDRSTNNFVSSTVIRGGNSVVVSGGAASVSDYEFPAGVPMWYRIRSYNAANALLTTFLVGPQTQDLADSWLKVPAAPFMNRPVTVVDASDRRLPARSQSFPIVGRNVDIAVSDRRSSMSYDLKIKTFTYDEESEMSDIMRSGEIILLHLPSAEHCMPGGYYLVGDVTYGPSGSKAKPGRHFNLPLTETAAPGPDVIGSTYSWQSVVADYASWTQEIAANATWAALLLHVGNPGDVIVS